MLRKQTHEPDPLDIDFHEPAENEQTTDVFLEEVNSVIEQHLGDASFIVPRLCQAMRMSHSQLFRKIKALTNKSIASHVRTVRLHKARELLLTTDLNISEVAYDVGFRDPAYFSRTFSEEFGLPPTEFRK